MLKKTLWLILFLFLSFHDIVFWYNTTELNLVYNKFYLQSQKKFSDPTLFIHFLESFDFKINQIILTSQSETKKNILYDLLTLNKAKITNLKMNKIKINKEENIFFNTSFLSDLKNIWYKTLILNENLEFQDNGTYKFIFKKYFEVDNDNYQYFIKNKLDDAIIIRYKGKFIITNDYKIEKKYSYKELYDLFNNKVDYSDSYSLINGEYYTYKYNYYVVFDKLDGLYLSDLAWNKISLEKTLVIKNIDGTYVFSNDFKKIRLWSEKIVKNITNKTEFLYNILDDNRNFEDNYDYILADMREVTLNLIQNKTTDEDKIQVIYKRVIDNITYYKNYSDGNKQVFSWILTYKNKTWVCDGYTKIFSYMLSIAGIDDVEIKRWFAFDTTDFPNFWHAWVRIGNYYYDPTFDDPIWNDEKSNYKYLYYKIPYELMYINRFDGLVIDNKYKWNLSERKKIVLKNMYDMYEKYKTYPLMMKIKNRLDLWLQYDDELTLSKLQEKVSFSEVKNYVFYDENGKKYMIAGLNFYVLNDNDLESILFDSNVNIAKSKFFHWYDKNGKSEYRFAYNIKYY